VIVNVNVDGLGPLIVLSNRESERELHAATGGLRNATWLEGLLFKVGIAHLTHPHLLFGTRNPAAVEKSQSDQAEQQGEANPR
jgi:hypothetical protein